MTWWDFLSDFILCLNSILGIDLFSVNVGDGIFVYVSIGGLLCSLLIVSAFLHYYVPRK